jgi:DNA-binding NarL/FixJ family response regulator
MGLYHIVLAEDHLMVREGIKKILSERADLKVAGEAGDGIGLLNFLNLMEQLPQMVIIDDSLPHLSGIEVTRTIKACFPGIKIMILTMHNEKEYFRRALSAGAEGYILKDDIPVELFSAIETLREGKTYVSPALSKEATTEWIEECLRNEKG